jgi:hypothetical protein
MTNENKKKLMNLLNFSQIAFIFHGRTDIFYTEFTSHPFILPPADDYGPWSQLGNGFYVTADVNAAIGYGETGISDESHIIGNKCVTGINLLKITYGNGTADLYKNTFGVLLKEISSYEGLPLLNNRKNAITFFNYHINKPNISFVANVRSILATEFVFLEKEKFNVWISGFKNIENPDYTTRCKRMCPRHINRETTFYNYKNEEKKYKLINCENHTYEDVSTKVPRNQFYYKKYLKYKQKYYSLKKHI